MFFRLSVFAFLFAAAGCNPSAEKSHKNDEAIARASLQIKSNSDKVPHTSDHAFIAKDVVIDKDGTEHVRFDRKYRGMRIIGGDLVVHSDAKGHFMNADMAAQRNIDIEDGAYISGETAVATAKGLWNGKEEKVSKPEQVVFAEGEEPLVAYEIVITGTTSNEEPSEFHVLVNATSNEVITSWDGIETVAGTGKGYFSGTVGLETLLVNAAYQLKDATRGNQQTNDLQGKKVGSGVLFTDADNQWGTGAVTDPASLGVDAQFGASATWDYFLVEHGRNGIKNNGIGATSRVRYGRRYNNAFWSDSCFCMTYGDGDGVTFNPFISLDVAAHEMSHGVTSATANLAYRGESGGLNEATSDIFGAMVEWRANLSSDVPDYLLGERLYKAGNRALRYMHKPSLDGRSPDCYTSTVGSLDVHLSSGIANHFFYLLAEGSNPAAPLPASPTCNSSTVAGLGRTKAGKIWFRALSTYMTSTTNYAVARAATLKAAVDLYGPGSQEQQIVAEAWSAVSVN
jgi:zinc metalloprotease ZmpA